MSAPFSAAAHRVSPRTRIVARPISVWQPARSPTRHPRTRRFEVYETVGSAIMESFEPAESLRLCLEEPRDSYPAGVSLIKIQVRPRYVDSLAAFIQDVRGEKQPDRSLEHELLVQETLLRATGKLAA